MKLKMLSGLPASGKTTFAKELVDSGGNWVRVNRDLLRTMLHFDKWSGKNEGTTVDTEKHIALTMLRGGKNVVVDDTNLGQKHLDMWKAVAKEANAKFEHKYIDTDIGSCIVRDAVRENKVGSAVIMNMAMQYNKVGYLKDIVVCDIDGTIADCSHRQHYVQGETKDWKGFFSEMDKDTLRQDVLDKVDDESVSNSADIILVSARPEEYRKVTEKWLLDKDIDYTHLILRKTGDKRPDTEVKQQIYETYLKHYNIVKVFDDRPCVIDMWRSNGLLVEDVSEGIDF